MRFVPPQYNIAANGFRHALTHLGNQCQNFIRCIRRWRFAGPVTGPIDIRQIIEGSPDAAIAAAIFNRRIISRCQLRQASPFPLVSRSYLDLNKFFITPDYHVNRPIPAVWIFTYVVCAVNVKIRLQSHVDFILFRFVF